MRSLCPQFEYELRLNLFSTGIVRLLPYMVTFYKRKAKDLNNNKKKKDHENVFPPLTSFEEVAISDKRKYFLALKIGSFPHELGLLACILHH